MRDRRLFLIFLFVRLLSVFIVQSWFVPDEFWQTTEVAHHLIYGYGWHSWEWQKDIRSISYPGVFAVLFLILKTLMLDYDFLLIHLPRVLSSVFFAIGDYSTCKLSISLYGRSSGHWTAVCLATSWFMGYCAPRTLSSCAEMTLLAICLSNYPWFHEKVALSKNYLWWGGIGCIFRPTLAVVLLPICLRHLIISQRKIKLLASFLLTGCGILLITILMDSLFYGHLTIVPLNFIQFNVLTGVSTHYGEHPWHWYFTQGLPAICGVHLIPIIFASVSEYKRHARILIPAGFAILIYSFLGHKEFRFLLPILPLLMCISGDWLFRNLSSKPTVTFLLLFIPNLLFLCYMGLIHQRGPLDLIHLLGEYAENSPEACRFLFLTPCHSTPLYSHLHKNVTIRFLTCDPNFSLVENYQDEAEVFFQNPQEWMQRNIFSSKVVQDEILQPTPMYSHIVMFDALSKRVGSLLSINNYNICEEVFNAHFIDGEKSQYLHIYCQK